MKTALRVMGCLLFILLAMSVPVSAHHSWSGYDMSNLTSLKGTVTQFDWGNPHVWIAFDVADEKGTIEKWNAGAPGPNRMAKTGWEKDTLKPGDQVTVIGHSIKDGTHNMRLVEVVLPDGRELMCNGGR